MQWHYAIGGRQFGPVTQERLDEMVTKGEISRETLVWKEGMPQWQRIDELMPDRFAATDGAPPLPGGAMMPAWEERKKLGIIPAAIDTVKQVLGCPSDTFARLRRDGGFWEPLFYNVLVSTAAALVSAALSVMLNISAAGPQKLLELISKTQINGQVSQSLNVSLNAGAVGVGAAIGAMLIALIATPIGVTVGVFIGSIISHLCLMMLGSGKRGLESTFRVVNYAAGSVAPFSAIPILGPLVGGIWALVLYVIGFAKVHEISTGRAVVAVLLPILVCCGASFGIAVLLFAALGATR
jgi:hypothetical protein